VAVVSGKEIESYGDCPEDAAILEVTDWLRTHRFNELFYSAALSEDIPVSGTRMTEFASGLLAFPVSRLRQDYLLWFRPERVRVIEWAGRPGKVPADIATSTESPLQPRTSFSTWREIVHGTSMPWHPAEIELATEFRSALLSIALERAEEMAELAEELGRANKELEAFSYSVSHDLRAPLRHIVGFSDLLLESDAMLDAGRSQRFLRNIKDSARLAGKLVDDLLSFSQMGRAALHPVRIDMNQLVRESIDRLLQEKENRSRKIEWRIEQLPHVFADPSFITLAIFNLLSNAVKFTAKRENAIVSISAQVCEPHDPEQGGTMMRFDVADNGVGFNMDYLHKLFGVFQRLHRMEDFHGTGIGLANVRRIVERHDGTVMASSPSGLSDSLHPGAVFSFTLPVTPESNALSSDKFRTAAGGH